MRIKGYNPGRVRTNKANDYKTRKRCRMKFQDADNAPGKFAKLHVRSKLLMHALSEVTQYTLRVLAGRIPRALVDEIRIN